MFGGTAFELLLRGIYSQIVLLGFQNKRIKEKMITRKNRPTYDPESFAKNPSGLLDAPYYSQMDNGELNGAIGKQKIGSLPSQAAFEDEPPLLEGMIVYSKTRAYHNS